MPNSTLLGHLDLFNSMFHVLGAAAGGQVFIPAKHVGGLAVGLSRISFYLDHPETPMYLLFAYSSCSSGSRNFFRAAYVTLVTTDLGSDPP